jgi:hypothetical protein
MNHASTSNTTSVASTFPTRAFAWTCLIVSIWVNISETARYFAFVKPMVQDALAMVPNVAPMNWPIFMRWGVWDTILVVMTMMFYWLFAKQFGFTKKSSLIAGTCNWFFFFVLFWFGLSNLGLAKIDLIAIALPLAWIECVVACEIARICFSKFPVH